MLLCQQAYSFFLMRHNNQNAEASKKKISIFASSFCIPFFLHPLSSWLWWFYLVCEKRHQLFISSCIVFFLSADENQQSVIFCYLNKNKFLNSEYDWLINILMQLHYCGLHKSIVLCLAVCRGVTCLQICVKVSNALSLRRHVSARCYC